MNQSTQLFAATAADYLHAWDAGEVCHTIEMGGLGPGYEQCIHVLVAELIRDHVSDPPQKGQNLKGWGEKTFERVGKKLGPSGAQWGAAKSLAASYLIFGPATCAEKYAADRRTMVSRAWPQV